MQCSLNFLQFCMSCHSCFIAQTLQTSLHRHMNGHHCHVASHTCRACDSTDYLLLDALGNKDFLQTIWSLHPDLAFCPCVVNIFHSLFFLLSLNFLPSSQGQMSFTQQTFVQFLHTLLYSFECDCHKRSDASGIYCHEKGKLFVYLHHLHLKNYWNK